MRIKEKFKFFIEYFEQNMPDAQTELCFSNPFELLVAVVLSAQCTDKRINKISPALFARFPDADTMARADAAAIFEYIRSVSYPNNKAKHLYGLACMLMEKSNGQVPQTVEQLEQLPGVGRKTAHVVASVVWNQALMAVDTHVFRVSLRLGLAPKSATTPLAVERALVAHLPNSAIAKAHHWLILHGRHVCLARKPKCNECGLVDICTYFKKNVLVLDSIK